MNKCIFLVLFAFVSLTLFAQRQTTSALVAQRQAAEADIARIDRQLKQLEGTKSDISQQLTLTKERLSKRRDVLGSIDAQISILDDRAREQSALATAHTLSLDSMYSVYQATVMAIYCQQHDTFHCDFLLPSAVIGSNTHRNHMATVLLRSIERRGERIRSIQGELGLELRQIAMRKEQLAILKGDEAEAMLEIGREKAKIERLSASIIKDEQGLNKEKERRVKLLASVQRQIEDAIRREVESSKRPTSGKSKPIINEKDPVSLAFVSAKGHMLCPINPAKVIDRYGVHDHPTQRGVKVDNRGVNLQSIGGAEVRAIAGGDIRKIFVVAGMGTSVLVRHGAYLTVYSNLDRVSVSVGQDVELGCVIGKVANDGILHFELWRETKTLNPADWIKF